MLAVNDRPSSPSRELTRNNNKGQKRSNFTKKNVFQKNQSFNFRNKGNNIPDLSTNDAHLRKSNVQEPNLVHANLLSSKELSLDSLIGGFSSSLPFMPLKHTERVLPKFLLYQPPTLDGSEFLEVDSWDQQNQARMAQLERSSSDLVGIYEELQKLREKEREVMQQRGLVDNENVRRSLENAIIFRGSCREMCPIYERIMRSVENDVRIFEKDSDTNKISNEKAVKAFSRPAAGQPPPLPSDVRPPQVLVKTLDYLIDNIIPQLPESQSFLWDRTRSIRQDFTYQNYLGPEAVDCNEKIVRVHILTLHRMAESQTPYSQQQELEQMNKALKTLSEMYAEYRSRGVSSPNEAEFRAYYMLSQIRDPELEREIQALPLELLNDEKIQLVLQLRNLISMNIVERGFQASENVLNLFALLFDMFNNQRIPVLMSYLLEIHLNEIRFYAMRSMKRAINKKSRPFPLDVLINLLSFNDMDDLVEFLEYYDIGTEMTDGAIAADILSLKYHSHIIPDQKPFRQSFSKRLDSRTSDFQALVNGGKLNTELIKFPSIGPFDVSQIKREGVASTLQTPAPPVTFGKVVNKEGDKLNSDEEEKNKRIAREHEIILEREKEEKRIREELEKQKVLEERTRQEQLKLENMKRSMLEKQELRKQKRYELVNLLTEKLGAELTHNVIKMEVETTVLPIVNMKKVAKEQKRKLTDAFSNGLFEAFINEQVYFQSLEALADVFREKMLKKKGIRAICKTAKECEKALDLRKRKRDELIDVITHFGLPRVVKRKRTSKNLSFSEMANVSASTSVGSLSATPSTKSNVDLHPFDLKPLASRTYKEEVCFKILLQVDDPVILRLFKKKFDLKDNSRRYIEGDRDVIVVNLNDGVDSNLFEHVNLLVFNLVGLEDFKDRKVELKELLHGIQLNNSFKFAVLIVYWELDKPADVPSCLYPLNGRDIIRDLEIPKNDNILKVDFVQVDSSLNLQRIENILNMSGTVALSAKGEFNARYKKEQHPKRNQKVKAPVTNVITSYPSQFNVSEDKYTKKFKPHIEASSKYKVLPKLLSSQGKTKKSLFKIDVYSTPRPKSSDLLQTPSFCDSSSISNLSNVTFETKDKEAASLIKKNSDDKAVNKTVQKVEEIVPKSILELREMAKKIKERHSKK